MSNDQRNVPHFLRVVRSIANVRGAAVPLAAVVTVMAGTYCSAETGVIVTGAGGAGGNASTSTSTGTGGTGTGGNASTSTGTGGSPSASTGVAVMPDGGM
jgi:hypothetical protein